MNKIKNYNYYEAQKNQVWKWLLDYTNSNYQLIYETIFEKCQELNIDEDNDHRCYTYGRQTGYWNEICYDLFEHYWKNGDMKKYFIKMLK